jgi:hypothetical protein
MPIHAIEMELTQFLVNALELEIKKEVKDTQMIVLKSSVFVGYFI